MLRIEMDEEERAAVREFAEERMLEWEVGLPTVDDLIPLTQLLIPHDLAMAFSVSAENCRSALEVNRASHHTLSSLRLQSLGFSANNLKSLPSFADKDHEGDPQVIEGDEPDFGSSSSCTFDKRKAQTVMETAEEADSDMAMENPKDDRSAPISKRPRLVWNPQLHKRFVDVVAHLGIKHAVPKTIMQLMNVEGLTRENVASHLQKYRLYLKRMNDDPSSAADQVLASTPVTQSLQEFNRRGQIPQLPLPFAGPLLSMPFLGAGYGHGHIGMPYPYGTSNK